MITSLLHLLFTRPCSSWVEVGAFGKFFVQFPFLFAYARGHDHIEFDVLITPGAVPAPKSATAEPQPLTVPTS